MTEFSDLGSHCAVETCNQKDFLPFKCDCCDSLFCLAHRAYGSHSCPAAGQKDFRAISCPLCGKTIKLADNQDPNTVWEAHSRTACQRPEGFDGINRKKRCAASGCREVLGLSNSHRCKSCGQDVCLSHRFADSHKCPGSGAGSSSSTTGENMKQRRIPSVRERQQKQRQRQQMRTANGADAPNTVKGTANKRQQMSNDAASGGEVCPHCAIRFADVHTLIAHVEAHHPADPSAHSYLAEAQTVVTGGEGGGGGGVGRRRSGGGGCPYCEVDLSDPVALVEHVEREHGGGASGAGAHRGSVADKCVLS